MEMGARDTCGTCDIGPKRQDGRGGQGQGQDGGAPLPQDAKSFFSDRAHPCRGRTRADFPPLTGLVALAAVPGRWRTRANVVRRAWYLVVRARHMVLPSPYYGLLGYRLLGSGHLEARVLPPGVPPPVVRIGFPIQCASITLAIRRVCGVVSEDCPRTGIADLFGRLTGMARKQTEMPLLGFLWVDIVAFNVESKKLPVWPYNAFKRVLPIWQSD